MAITLPFTFTNGTVIEAPQVNANFSALASAVNGSGTAITVPTLNVTGTAGNPGNIVTSWGPSGTGGIQITDTGGVGGLWIETGKPNGVGRSSLNTALSIEGGVAIGSGAFPNTVNPNSVAFAHGMIAGYSDGLEIVDTTEQYGLWVWSTNDLPASNSYLTASLDVQHNIVAGGTITPSSDARTKEDITDYSCGLSQIQRLRPREWVRHGQKQAGLVGQEVEDIIPAAVPRRADDYRLIDPMALIATLVNSVNELAAKVEMLERG